MKRRLAILVVLLLSVVEVAAQDPTYQGVKLQPGDVINFAYGDVIKLHLQKIYGHTALYLGVNKEGKAEFLDFTTEFTKGPLVDPRVKGRILTELQFLGYYGYSGGHPFFDIFRLKEPPMDQAAQARMLQKAKDIAKNRWFILGWPNYMCAKAVSDALTAAQPQGGGINISRPDEFIDRNRFEMVSQGKRISPYEEYGRRAAPNAKRLPRQETPLELVKEWAVNQVELNLMMGRTQQGASTLLNRIRVMRDEDGTEPTGSNITLDEVSKPAKGEPRKSEVEVTPSSNTTGSYNLMPVEVSRDTVKMYGGIPGGVVLEGSGPDLSRVQVISYNERFNAIEMDDQDVYVFKIAPRLVALLCRAIGEDKKERVGVSAADPPIVYGKVPEDSQIAWDMLLADVFLADIVFAKNDLTKNYRFADGFIPMGETVTYNVAVFFKFTDFRFQTDGHEMHLSNSRLAIQLVPLSDKVAEDGNFLPDEKAIRDGRMSKAYATNAQHISDNISYYRKERIVKRMFAYGETAAFMRSLKAAGFNVNSLAETIDQHGQNPVRDGGVIP